MTERGLNLLATAPRVPPWSGVRKVLLKKFRNDDSEQQHNTVTYHQALSGDKAFRNDAEDVERYIYSFRKFLTI